MRIVLADLCTKIVHSIDGECPDKINLSEQEISGMEIFEELLIYNGSEIGYVQDGQRASQKLSDDETMSEKSQEEHNGSENKTRIVYEFFPKEEYGQILLDAETFRDAFHEVVFILELKVLLLR